jgi:hypothetical protein
LRRVEHDSLAQLTSIATIPRSAAITSVFGACHAVVHDRASLG